MTTDTQASSINSKKMTQENRKMDGMHGREAETRVEDHVPDAEADHGTVLGYSAENLGKNDHSMEGRADISIATNDWSTVEIRESDGVSDGGLRADDQTTGMEDDRGENRDSEDRETPNHHVTHGSDSPKYASTDNESSNVAAMDDGHAGVSNNEEPAWKRDLMSSATSEIQSALERIEECKTHIHERLQEYVNTIGQVYEIWDSLQQEEQAESQLLEQTARDVDHHVQFYGGSD